MTGRRARASLAVGLAVVLGLAGLAGCTASSGAPGAAGSGSASLPAPAVSTSAAAPGGGPAAGDPVTVFELADQVVQYQAYVGAQLALLVPQTQALARDTEAGDDAAAKRDWLTAHLTYHRLGAAYGAFGDLGKAVDGSARGLPRGVDDPGFTGFHRVEQLLWRGAGARAAAPAAARLAHDVAALLAKASQLEISANTFTVRAHEILEDTLQITLTGADDYGSGTGLATTAADLAGTRTVIGLLRPVLARRAPALLARIDADLDAVRAALPAPPGADGPWTSPTALPLAQRQRLDAAVGRALETLSAVPGLLEVQDED